ncbi:MAG: hypothetical protein M3Z23_01505 [Acidobacteriota bacterium]|nr:hypothetical protein [Acidobacteriota bacterium]
MNIDERLDRLTGIVETLAETVMAHDNQIEGLIRAGEEQGRRLADMSKQWQAYINTPPRH